jgi:hypothetical protein
VIQQAACQAALQKQSIVYIGKGMPGGNVGRCRKPYKNGVWGKQ